MNLQYRTDLLIRLGHYILGNDEEWLAAKEKASRENGWFIPAFIERSCDAIGKNYLAEKNLHAWVASHSIPDDNPAPKNVGIIMAGNIPLVGFHDFLCVFITGNIATIKPSSKDDVLIRHLVKKLIDWDPACAGLISFAEMLKGCDAYIATGSNNSAGYFEYYFRKYPSLIRRNRTSVAILTGEENEEQLLALADDVYLYFGLGCRNVTKLHVPEGYDFVPLLEAFRKYNHLADHHKYKNNYDYNLAIHLLNRDYYMTNSSILLVENKNNFSPISELYYEFYPAGQRPADIAGNIDIQCIAGEGYVPFGQTQEPGLDDFADGVNTIKFLQQLK